MRREPSQTEVESTTARRRAGVAWLWVAWCLSLALPAFRLEVEARQIVWIWGWECFSLYVSSGSRGQFCPVGFLHPGWYANLTFALGTAFLANHRVRTAFWVSLAGAVLAVGTGVLAFVLVLSIRLLGPGYLVWAGCMVTLVWFSRREVRRLPNPAEYLSLDRIPRAQTDETTASPSVALTGTRAGRELAKWMGITLAVLLSLYFAAYYSAVEPIVGINDALEPMTVYPWYQKLERPDHTPFAESGWSTFFAPAHALDRHVRPDVWELRPFYRRSLQ